MVAAENASCCYFSFLSELFACVNNIYCIYPIRCPGRLLNFWFLRVGTWGGGVLPYISHIGQCTAPKGMVFEPFWSEIG